MATTNNFQRVGATSNTEAGREFEEAAHIFFETAGIKLERGFSVPVGYKVKKSKMFDLGSAEPPILVECKSYTWTEIGNSPSAKIRGMNEAMLLFSVAPPEYQKILLILKHKHQRSGVTLASHYIKNQGHLIGPGVEIWEFDLDAKVASTRDFIKAISESVWNALDADAAATSVDLVRNALGGLESIVIRDNGTGITKARAEHDFESLGDPWKLHAPRTPVLPRYPWQGRARSPSVLFTPAQSRVEKGQTIPTQNRD
ncbi:ATP-binding protein [Bradyrhizobium sp. CCBAU 21362]|uniref:ATP-binding protein n=1 Tax=Bradyrhizobium sp. CCBAU 21362 TaxID=1325082 RepID=UPI0023054EE4|nr:ATP-binding protein [Bradyrhizobium sp. CCBAU 21362]